jgi:hypothetical protein
MSTQIRWGQAVHLAELITELGGTIPKPLQDIIATAAAVNDWTPPPATDLETQVRRGELNATNATKKLTEALVQPNRKPADLIVAAKHALAQRFAELTDGEPGDAIITSLQPAFGAAVTTMTNAAEVVDATMTADRVLEVDGGAQAWADLAEARRTLDRLHTVVTELVETFEVVGQIDGWQHGRGSIRTAAMYTDNPGSVDRICQALRTPDGAARGGKWHRVAHLLALHTPTTARATLAALHQAHLDTEAAHYAAIHSQPMPGYAPVAG